MNDPFLREIYYDSHVFVVGGIIHPVSIKDQIIRSQLFVKRAFENGYIKKGGLPLVVAGGGVSGIVAAIDAAARGVPVVLLELEPWFFPLQRRCHSRKIDPTQYDWPAKHWSQGRYPFSKTTLKSPLPWLKPTTSSVLAASWELRFQDFVAIDCPKNGWNVQAFPGHFFDHYSLDPAGDLVVSVKPKGNPKQKCPSQLVACALLIATGFGTEVCKLQHSPTIGIEFWDSDHLSVQNYNLSIRPRFLISGAGDGALQDYLRVITNPKFDSARSLYEEIKVPRRFESRIREDQVSVERQLKWGSHPLHDHAPLRWLHRRTKKVVGRLLKLPDMNKCVERLLRNPLPELILSFPCDHFGNVYALNRFLVLLLARYLKHGPEQQSTLKGNHMLESVGGSGRHKCNQDWRNCYGQPHDYRLLPADCAFRRLKGAPFSDIADVVIIRHGVTCSSTWLSPKIGEPRRRRDILPYALFVE